MTNVRPAIARVGGPPRRHDCVGTTSAGRDGRFVVECRSRGGVSRWTRGMVAHVADSHARPQHVMRLLSHGTSIRSRSAGTASDAFRNKRCPKPERRLVENVVKRVQLWRDVDPFYPDQTRGLPKTSESRGTEAV
jgi:hypothetical protein